MFLHIFQLETFEYRIIHHISFDYFHFILNYIFRIFIELVRLSFFITQISSLILNYI